MGPAGYTVKLEQWEEEDRQLAAAGIPNPYDAYPDDRSKNWLRARSKLVIKDYVAVIVFNNKEAKKLAADIKEKIAESLGMVGQKEYDVLSQCLGRPKQPGHGVVSPATRSRSMHGLSMSRCIGRGRGRRPTHQLIRKR
jgi:hypothetical protein